MEYENHVLQYHYHFLDSLLKQHYQICNSEEQFQQFNFYFCRIVIPFILLYAFLFVSRIQISSKMNFNREKLKFSFHFRWLTSTFSAFASSSDALAHFLTNPELYQARADSFGLLFINLCRSHPEGLLFRRVSRYTGTHKFILQHDFLVFFLSKLN